MPIKMQHPDNGATHAYTREEVAELERRGWTVAPPKVRTPDDVVAEAIEDVKVAIAELQAPRRRPGRPSKAK